MSTFVIEEEHGTDTRTIHHHNGYCAADFRGVPMQTQRELAALTALRPVTSLAPEGAARAWADHRNPHSVDVQQTTRLPYATCVTWVTCGAPP